jgi:hypothetical protein
MLAGALMPPVRSTPGELPRRRGSDERIEELLVGQARIEEQLKASADTASTQARSVEKALDLIQRSGEDPANTPAGRELLRKAAANTKAIADIAPRVDALEDFRLEVKSAIRWFKGATGLATTIATVMSMLWTAHQLHWFGL